MKTKLWGIGIVLVGCAAAIGCVTTYPYHQTVSMGQPSPVAEPAGGSDEPFYDDLAPYGRWVYVSGPGWVWSPYGVQADWRPYQLGHWVFTDYGWTWSSDEQWGWAVYHYGRWNQDPSYGWVWVPGTEWGPAWVAWHEGGGYVGWAPLPWQVRVEAGVGLNWAGLNVTIASSAWCFTSTRYLVDPSLRTRIVPASRNVTLIQVTKNVTNYTYIDNRVVNQGVQVERIGRAAGHTIPRYHVSESDDVATPRGGKVRGNDFVVFRQDPPRGRNSQGRTDPPGHDDNRYRPRDNRPGYSRPEPPPPTGPTGPDAPPSNTTQTPPPPQPPPTNRGQETRGQGREDQPGRGRRFMDQMMGKEPPRRSPQESTPPAPPAPPAPPTAPGQTQTTTTPPTGPANPPADTRPGNSSRGDRHDATTTPGRSEPPKGQADQNNGNDKEKAAREAAARGRKPKQDAQKDNGKDSDEKKKDKPDSNP